MQRRQRSPSFTTGRRSCDKPVRFFDILRSSDRHCCSSSWGDKATPVSGPHSLSYPFPCYSWTNSDRDRLWKIRLNCLVFVPRPKINMLISHLCFQNRHLYIHHNSNSLSGWPHPRIAFLPNLRELLPSVADLQWMFMSSGSPSHNNSDIVRPYNCNSFPSSLFHLLFHRLCHAIADPNDSHHQNQHT